MVKSRFDTSYITPVEFVEEGTFHIPFDRGRKFRYDTPQAQFMPPVFDDPQVGLSWLWQDRIPLGKLTVIEGPPAAGKSFLMAGMAALVSRGSAWPDGPPGKQPAGEVLFVCSEREANDNVKPRVRRYRHDFTRILFLSDIDVFHPTQGLQVKRTYEFPDDVVMLEYYLKGCPYTRLVVIDPIRDFCATPRLLRQTLKKLDELAAKYNVAIVALIQAEIKFTREGPMQKAPRTWDEAARCVWCVVRDPDDPDLIRFEPKRITFCREPEGVGFRITPEGRLKYEKLSPRVALFEKCKQWLNERMKEGAVWAGEAQVDAAQFGFSKTMVTKAREKLGIQSDRQGGIAGSGSWWWTRDGRPPDRPDPLARRGVRRGNLIPDRPKTTEELLANAADRQKSDDEFVKGMSQLLLKHAALARTKRQQAAGSSAKGSPVAEDAGAGNGQGGEGGNGNNGDLDDADLKDFDNFGADESGEDDFDEGDRFGIDQYDDHAPRRSDPPPTAPNGGPGPGDEPPEKK